jgi:hypothetical protein
MGCERMIRSSVLAALLASAVACAGASHDAPTSRHPVGPQGDGDDPARGERQARKDALAAAEPDAVAPSERGAYFDAVTGGGTGYRNYEVSARSSPDPDTPDPERIRKVLRLDQLVGTSDPTLAPRIHAWLVGVAGELMQAYANQTAKVLASPPTSPWHRSEAAWVTWVNSHVTTFSENDAYGIGMNVFAG